MFFKVLTKTEACLGCSEAGGGQQEGRERRGASACSCPVFPTLSKIFMICSGKMYYLGKNRTIKQNYFLPHFLILNPNCLYREKLRKAFKTKTSQNVLPFLS